MIVVIGLGACTDPEPTDTDSRQNSGSNCTTSGTSDLLQRLTRERDAKIDSIKKEIKDLEAEMAAEGEQTFAIAHTLQM